jgi:nitrogen regulatory protein PII
MNLVLFVLHDPRKLQKLLDAWQKAGVAGATVLNSTGMGRLSKSHALRDDLPLMPSMDDFLPRVEDFSRTVFSLIDDEGVVERVVKATEDVVGDLDQPDRGILVVLPVSHFYGLRKPGSSTSDAGRG